MICDLGFGRDTDIVRPMPDERPNILLLISDNQRLDTIGSLGHTPCRTPTWDRMAGEGALFERVRTTSPVCSPARASIFTGLHPQEAGMQTIGFDYAEKDDGTGGEEADGITVEPFSQRLRDAGYETLYTGKWHLGEHNIRRWFDDTAATDQAFRDYTAWCRLHGISSGYVFGDPERAKPYRSRHYPHMSIPRTGLLDIPDDKEHNFWILSHAIELLETRRSDRPLFMTLSFEGPHPPLVVPEAYHDMYDPSDMSPPPNWGPAAGEPGFLADSYYRRQFLEFGEKFDAWRKSIAVYWGYATYIDHLFGLFLDRCEEAGLLDNTLVIMVSDHGEMLGQHGLNQKMSPYEENLLVPCVLRWPGRVPAGARVQADATLLDIAPTALAAAGIDGALASDGRNLLEYCDGSGKAPAARDCFSQWNMTPFEQTWHGVEPWRLIVRHPWKYVLHGNGEEELYYLEEDAYETDNRCGRKETHAIQDELRSALLDWCRRTGDGFLERVQ